MAHTARLLAMLLLLAHVAQAQAPPAPATRAGITTEKLPQGVLGELYPARVQASGGAPPLKWTLAEGRLPRGLSLDDKTGEISGVPAESGEFRFTVQLTDSAEPPHEVRRELRLAILLQLTISWKQVPALQGKTISAAVNVSNNSVDPIDLTFIAVGVNEINKAFTLGYQHFTLQPRTANFAIPFSSTLPQGRYVVHADAVGEVARKNAIYRARLQTPGPMYVQGSP